MHSKRTVLSVVFAIFTAIPVAAIGPKTMTPDELRQALQAVQSAKSTDEAVAQQLAEVRLSARLTGTPLRQLVAMSPGPKTAQALHAIADSSAFLDPAPSEIPDRPAPSAQEQSAMFSQALRYAVHVLPTLPNFLATRVTEHYVDTMRGIDSESVQRGGLYLLGTYRTPIALRAGRETDDPSVLASLPGSQAKGRGKDAKADAGANRGLSSWGEFGPILKVVLGDSIKGKLSWARWEVEDGKTVGVLRFAIDRSISHYGVNFCCETTADFTNTSIGIPDVVSKSVFRQAGYHGTLELDRDTGTILRLTIEADLDPSDEIKQASMMVEYGPVKIGDDLHICPKRSVAVSISNARFESHGELDTAKRMLLNDVEFADYHRFGSEATLITEIPEEGGQTGKSPNPAPAAEPSPAAPTTTPARPSAHGENPQAQPKAVAAILP